MNNVMKILILFAVFFSSLGCAFSAPFIDDDFVNETLKDKDFKEIKVNTDYNYTRIHCIPIKLQIDKKITTRKNLHDGDILTFKVKNDVRHNRKVLLKKGTVVTGRVKTYMTRGWGGIPGQIILDDFEIPGIDSNQLKSTYIKKGLNLTLLIMPIKWVLTPIPFVGSFTNLIIGGSANIDSNDTIVIYYYPDWQI